MHGFPNQNSMLQVIKYFASSLIQVEIPNISILLGHKKTLWSQKETKVERMIKMHGNSYNKYKFNHYFTNKMKNELFIHIK
jgi:hypothetical protein